MPRPSIDDVKTELNLCGPESNSGRLYANLRKTILAFLVENDIKNKTLAGEALWGRARDLAMTHQTLVGFTAKYNTPQRGNYAWFHRCLDELIIDVGKKHSESLRNAGINPDAHDPSPLPMAAPAQQVML